MIKTDTRHLLFLHPEAASPVPVIDAVTRTMAGAWQARTHGMSGYRGFHRCTGCDAESDNRDYFVVTVAGARLKTNLLAIHYLAFHRADVTSTSSLHAARTLDGVAGRTSGLPKSPASRACWITPP